MLMIKSNSQYKISNMINGKYLYVDFNIRDCYYHWWFDVMNCVMFYFEIKNIKSILLNRNITLKFQKECFELMNLTYELNNSNIYEEILVPCKTSRIRDLKEYFNPYPVKMMRKFRDMFIKNLTSTHNKFIYASRKGEKTRHIENEDELIVLLNKYGFEIIYPNDLSLIEQIQIYYNAKIVIAAHGGSFTNIAFAKEPYTVIEFLDKSYWYMDNCFAEICHYIGHKHIFIDAKSTEKNPHMSNMNVDLDLTENILKILF